VTGVRRTPVQERSNETVRQVLEAASALLARLPVEQVTTTRIAAEAGISVGALYRFYPDRQSILDALVVAHTEELRKHLEPRLANLEMDDGPKFLGEVVDAFVSFLDDRPDFRAIVLGKHISGSTRATHASPKAGPAGLLHTFMTELLGLDPRELELPMQVAIEAGERVIAYAYEQDSPEDRRRVIEELKRLLSTYLFG
jgi:AcrR family transcriptional regulator